MAKKPLLQIKDIMAAVDRKDYNYYTNLTDEQRKSLNLWMTQRYASSVQGKMAGHYLVMVNEFMNTHWSDVSKHPELQWKLMCLAGTGKVQFHPFVKVPKAKRKKDKVEEIVRELFPLLKHDEIRLFLKMNSKEEIKVLAMESGVDDKTLDEAFK
tara:strand:+ start:3563 stop:4027 length:465 start_codon:yes stop_codon:yes gene_type:complete